MQNRFSLGCCCEEVPEPQPACGCSTPADFTYPFDNDNVLGPVSDPDDPFSFNRRFVLDIGTRVFVSGGKLHMRDPPTFNMAATFSSPFQSQFNVSRGFANPNFLFGYRTFMDGFDFSNNIEYGPPPFLIPFVPLWSIQLGLLGGYGVVANPDYRINITNIAETSPGVFEPVNDGRITLEWARRTGVTYHPYVVVHSQTSTITELESGEIGIDLYAISETQAKLDAVLGGDVVGTSPAFSIHELTTTVIDSGCTWQTIFRDLRGALVDWDMHYIQLDVDGSHEYYDDFDPPFGWPGAAYWINATATAGNLYIPGTPPNQKANICINGAGLHNDTWTETSVEIQFSSIPLDCFDLFIQFSSDVTKNYAFELVGVEPTRTFRFNGTTTPAIAGVPIKLTVSKSPLEAKCTVNGAPFGTPIEISPNPVTGLTSFEFQHGIQRTEATLQTAIPLDHWRSLW